MIRLSDPDDDDGPRLGCLWCVAACAVFWVAAWFGGQAAMRWICATFY